MKKSLFVSMLVALLAVAFALPGMAEEGKDGIALNHLKGEKPVVFNHSTHKTVECGYCHHKGEANQSCVSEGCHANVDPKSKKGVDSWYFVTHKAKKDKMSCVNCHKDSAKEQGWDKDKKKSLTGCKNSACHS